MSKFRIRMKLQGLELEIDGEREDAALISRNLGSQLSGILSPAGRIIEGDAEPLSNGPSEIPTQTWAVSTKTPTRRRRQLQSSSGGSPVPKDASGVIDFTHSPEKHGTPLQAWKTADKCLWLMRVLTENAKGDQFTTKTLVETFNKHFKQSGTITSSNTSRDLGRLKSKDRPSPIGEDTAASPSTWFLTEEGQKRASQLMQQALGGKG